jgi:hypothetical protein
MIKLDLVLNLYLTVKYLENGFANVFIYSAYWLYDNFLKFVSFFKL